MERREPDHSLDEWEPKAVDVRAPPNQLRLSEEKLDQDANIFLKAKNPNAPHTIARFSFKEHVYKNEPTVDQTFFLVSIDGSLAHMDSETGKAQIERDLAREEAHRRAEQRRQERLAQLGPDAEEEDIEGLEDTKMKNQFNFSDRASQTFNNPMRDRAIMTEPPPTKGFSGSASHSIIFDAYMAQNEKKSGSGSGESKRARASASGSSSGGASSSTSHLEGPGSSSSLPGVQSGGAPASASAVNPAEDPTKSQEFLSSLKVMERMVVQNLYADVALDFKYYENLADELQQDEGNLLPLWEFGSEKVRKKHVTSLCWNHKYPDLFAVAYGSYDFQRQGTGVINCFSLKNPAFPEYSFTTEYGATCLDFHPKHPSLLAVGLYDGTVMIFDVRQRSNRPIFQSTIKSGKHTDPVWQVGWQDDDMGKNLNFFSISSDGRVTNWTLSKNELQYSNVLELKLVGGDEGSEMDTDSALAGLAGGVCFDFHPFSEHLFLVGTEEGYIHKCSKAYNSQYSATYFGHYMAVYKVQWNPYHRRIFLSASADWTVKIWDHEKQKPVLSFDLGNAVNDAAWAPYSSTVFAAVTADGKVHVFDLNQNKNEPMCSQQVIKKAKLTHICFNSFEPIILVGDDKGRVISLKLSPNLRKLPVPKEGETKALQELQVEQVERLLTVAEKGDAIASAYDMAQASSSGY